jgi:subtilisin
MAYTLLTVTFNDLKISSVQVGIVFGSRYDVIDGVFGLQEGKEMLPRLIYYFKGIGSAVVLVPPEELAAVKHQLGHEWVFYFNLPEHQLVHHELLSFSEMEHYFHPSNNVLAGEVIEDGTAMGGTIDPLADKPDDAGWNLDAIESNSYQHYTGKGVKIAILDSGIQRDHPEFGDRVRGGVSFANGGGEAKDPFNDSMSHGTPCAGIAAGRTTGVAPEADLYSVKIFKSGKATATAMLAGLCWSLWNNMDVVCISMVGDTNTKLIPAFVNAVQALTANNCAVVACAGDSSSTLPIPANARGVIAVGVYNGPEPGRVPANSNQGGKGNQITVVAPQNRIWTTGTGDDTFYMFTGSSAAGPHVAGLIARIKQKLPGITPLQIYSKLTLSARHVAGTQPDWDRAAGAGLIDCRTALDDFND